MFDLRDKAQLQMDAGISKNFFSNTMFSMYKMLHSAKIDAFTFTIKA